MDAVWIGALTSVACAVGGWFIGKRSSDTTQLRALYANWATTAYDFLKCLEGVRDDFEIEAASGYGFPVEPAIEAIHQDPAGFKGTGIPDARHKLERSNFVVDVSDSIPAFSAEVDQLTTKILTLNLKSGFAAFDNATKELTAFCKGRIRERFQLRDWEELKR